MINWIKRNQIVTFSILAYLYSWIIWSPLVLSAKGIIDTYVPPWIHLIGSWGPLLAAFTVTVIVGKGAGFRELIRRLFRWKVGLRWFLVATSPIILFLIALSIDILISNTSFDFNLFGRLQEISGVVGVAGWVVMILTFGFGEETGWRGFALPRLQITRSASKATLILIPIWIFWHLPLFFYKESFIEMGVFGAFGWAISLAFGAVVLTWLYNSSKSSILIVAIWHGTFNAAVASGEGNVSMITSVLVILWAIIIQRLTGTENLSKSKKQIIIC